jgi:hypothetical protein
MINKKGIAPVILSTLIFLVGIVVLGLILMYVVDNVIKDRENKFDVDYVYLDAMQSTRPILMHKTSSGIYVHELITKRVHENNHSLLIQEVNKILVDLDNENRWIYNIKTDKDGFPFIRQPADERINPLISRLYMHSIPNEYGYEIEAVFILIQNRDYQEFVRAINRMTQPQNPANLRADLSRIQ